jgi:hypothetical protein
MEEIGLMARDILYIYHLSAATVGVCTANSIYENFLRTFQSPLVYQIYIICETMKLSETSISEMRIDKRPKFIHFRTISGCNIFV